ncbi:unnamed protein product, partial [Musa textilis]
ASVSHCDILLILILFICRETLIWYETTLVFLSEAETISYLFETGIIKYKGHTLIIVVAHYLIQQQDASVRHCDILLFLILFICRETLIWYETTLVFLSEAETSSYLFET